jgi:hypothetical protein
MEVEVGLADRGTLRLELGVNQLLPAAGLPWKIGSRAARLWRIFSSWATTIEDSVGGLFGHILVDVEGDVLANGTLIVTHQIVVLG